MEQLPSKGRLQRLFFFFWRGYTLKERKNKHDRISRVSAKVNTELLLTTSCNTITEDHFVKQEGVWFKIKYAFSNT